MMKRGVELNQDTERSRKYVIYVPQAIDLSKWDWEYSYLLVLIRVMMRVYLMIVDTTVIM